METKELQNKITQIQNKREFLVKLLEQPNLGTLKTDVEQALYELDDLISELKITFPD
jgi:hypothetical protein